MITIPSYKSLLKLPIKNEGDIALCTDTQKLYTYTNGEWTEMKTKDSELKLSLYDLNKQIISQLKPLTSAQIEDRVNAIKEWSEGTFHMLYGKDISYFTLFRKMGLMPLNDESLGQEVFSCLNDIGDVVAADCTSAKDAWEFWVRIPEEDNEITCLYLFNYDKGVVNYG